MNNQVKIPDEQQKTARECLRLATVHLHRQLDQMPMLRRLIGNDLTINDYRQFMLKMACWYQSIEPDVFSSLGKLAPDDQVRRRKLPALKKDLSLLGLDEKSATCTSPVICFLSEAEALGALYVMEGSTQGGKLIIKRVKQALGEIDACHYLQVYGDHTDELWHSFTAYIDGVLVNDTNLSEAVSGAEKIYQSLINWFKPIPGDLE